MGDRLYITRKERYSDDEGSIISAEEWLQLVEEDDDLLLDDENPPYMAVCSWPSQYHVPRLNWSDGNIVSEYDAPLILKMVEIAEGLGAKVQDDEGKIHIGGEKPLWRRPWWRRLLGC